MKPKPTLTRAQAWAVFIAGMSGVCILVSKHPIESLGIALLGAALFVMSNTNPPE